MSRGLRGQEKDRQNNELFHLNLGILLIFNCRIEAQLFFVVYVFQICHVLRPVAQIQNKGLSLDFGVMLGLIYITYFSMVTSALKLNWSRSGLTWSLFNLLMFLSSRQAFLFEEVLPVQMFSCTDKVKVINQKKLRQ